MWYVKKAASKVAKISQQVLKQQTQIQKRIRDIISSKHEVVPTKKMNDLAVLSFQMQNFQQIINNIDNKLKQIKYEQKSLKKKLNVLILVSYLIKYGASGFIDEFRLMMDTFERFQLLKQKEISQIDDKIRITLNDIHERVKYIRQLLFDKSTLMREKEVARLIRQKLIIMGGDYSTLINNQRGKSQKADDQRVEDFLQHYVWKYTKKIDSKLDQITDALIAKIDKYLDYEQPQNFQIEELNSEHKTITKSQFQLSSKTIQEQERFFIKQKIPNLAEEKPNTNYDLLDLQEKQKLELQKANKQTDISENLLQIEKQIGESESHLRRDKTKVQEIMSDLQIESFRKQLQQETRLDRFK